jgi:hypothetical protein
MRIDVSWLGDDASSALSELSPLENARHTDEDHARPACSLGYLVLDSASVSVVGSDTRRDEVLTPSH